MNKKRGSVYKVNEKGFISEGYWDRPISYRAVDENGEEMDCYSDVVGDINDRQFKVNKYYKREKFKNVLLNVTFKFQLGFLIFSLTTTFLTLFMYIWSVVSENKVIIDDIMKFFEDKLKPATFAKFCEIVNPAIIYIERFGLESAICKVLSVLSVVSFIALIIYMIGRDHITVRWVCSLLHVRPLCDVKIDSDKRLMRLQSDLYSIQLRRHEVKYASHSK